MTDARRREINERLAEWMGYQRSQKAPEWWLRPGQESGAAHRSNLPDYFTIGEAMGLARHLVDTDDGVDAVRITIVKFSQKPRHRAAHEIERRFGRRPRRACVG